REVDCAKAPEPNRSVGVQKDLADLLCLAGAAVMAFAGAKLPARGRPVSSRTLVVGGGEQVGCVVVAGGESCCGSGADLGDGVAGFAAPYPDGSVCVG